MHFVASLDAVPAVRSLVTFIRLPLCAPRNPELNFAAMARGMGVPASTATTCEELADQFCKALAEPGPHVIEALVPSAF
jgi:thiamine pyrophosphate-dependent acetolactate synthase large subunit-like protein